MIVVGVDGSESSRDALAWAVEEARLRDVPLHVVTAWHLEPIAVATPGYAPPYDRAMIESFRRGAEQALSAALDSVREAAKGIRLTESVVQGGATEVLVEAAKEADLLVVGSRGHGSFAGLLLGSVSQQAAHHAQCPVVIVRHRAGAA